MIGRSPAWRDAAFAVVDLELTGLDPRDDEIVSWCVVPVHQGAIALADVREGRVRAGRSSSPAAVRVHGLRDLDLATEPSGDAALTELADALAGRVAVAHCAHVERAFLTPVLDRLGRPPLRRMVDTMVLARRAGLADAVDLGTLADALGLPVHAPHTAAGDALTTAQVFLALATRLDVRRAQTVRSLTRR